MNINASEKGAAAAAAAKLLAGPPAPSLASSRACVEYSRGPVRGQPDNLRRVVYLARSSFLPSLLCLMLRS